MPADPTLDLDLAAVTDESRRLAAAIKPGSARWDVIVVGSGAAGGMAAFQLATAGIKVLMLEAGRMLDHKKEYRTMEWPYASPRRSRLPPDHRALAVAEYNFLDRPYGDNPAFAKYKKLASYGGNSFTRNWVVNEKEQDIAILRTYGLEPARVTRVFFVQGAVIGSVGTLVGVVLGLVLALNVHAIVPWLESTFGFRIMPGDVFYVTEIPSEVHVADVVLVPLLAFAITILATLYPSRRAARVAPAQALRYE